MTHWHRSSTIFVIDDSDDEAEQYVPQHQDKDAGDGDEGNIDHTSPTDASSSISTELGRQTSPCTTLYQSADTSERVCAPAASVEQAQEPMEYIAHCQVRRHPCDLLQFYEPAEGAGDVFTSCRTCRQSRERTANDLHSAYQCACGSLLRTTSKKGHERSKKHKAWSRSTHAARASRLCTIHKCSAA